MRIGSLLLFTATTTLRVTCAYLFLRYPTTIASKSNESVVPPLHYANYDNPTTAPSYCHGWYARQAKENPTVAVAELDTASVNIISS